MLTLAVVALYGGYHCKVVFGSWHFLLKVMAVDLEMPFELSLC